MRIATLCGILLWVVGCNQLPPEDVGGDDQSLSNGGAKDHDAGVSANDTKGTAGAPGDVPNGTAEASPNGVEQCQLKVKECYAQGNDPAACDALLKGCVPPPPAGTPACGEDCDASVRACYAKGVDAKTCDALYHECLGGKPANGGTGTAPGSDPNLDCMLKAKECYGQNQDPAICDALLKSCSPPDPVPDPAIDCELKYKKCLEAGVDTATCDTLVADCRKSANG